MNTNKGQVVNEKEAPHKYYVGYYSPNTSKRGAMIFRSRVSPLPSTSTIALYVYSILVVVGLVSN